MKVCGPTKYQVTLERWFDYVKENNVYAVLSHAPEFATYTNYQTCLSGLMTAFLHKNYEVFDLLLPLEISVRSGKKYLLQTQFLSGGKLPIPLGSTIFHFVVAAGADSYFYYLLRHIYYNSLNYLVQLTNKNEETFLFLAATLGYLPPFLDGMVVQNSIYIYDVNGTSVVMRAALYGRLRILLYFQKICSGDVLNMQRTQFINLEYLRREIKQMCFQALDSDEFMQYMYVIGEGDKYGFRYDDRNACADVLRQICGYV